MGFGEAIRAARKDKGYSQLDVAKKLEVAQVTVSGWERGIYLPGPTYLIGLAKFLGLDVGDLVALAAAKPQQEPVEASA